MTRYGGCCHMRTRFGRGLGLVLVLLLGLTACSLGGGNDSLPAPTHSPLQVFDRSGTTRTAFATPGHNITCAFEAPSDADQSGTVRCEIAVKIWQPPAQPASCPVNWGRGLALDRHAAVLCEDAQDREPQGMLQLPFGTSIRFDPFSCTSQPAGIDCVNTVTGAGFMLGRERYELRNP
jgi:hypothetical protein